MRKIASILLLLAFALSLKSTYAQRTKATLRPLKPLLGHWEMDVPDGKIIEVWTYDSPARFSGKSFQVGAKSDSTLLEEAKIIARNGKLYFIPTVSGQNEGKPVEFVILSRAGRKYVFENKSHDFPQRVGYHLLSANELLAWIEGSKNGKDRKTEFRYRRSGSR